MNDEPRDHRDPPAAITPPPATPDAAIPTEPLSNHQLTPEEQMALFEQELKETDWGHQPC
jgi:hypothetical protein